VAVVVEAPKHFLVEASDAQGVTAIAAGYERVREGRRVVGEDARHVPSLTQPRPRPERAPQIVSYGAALPWERCGERQPEEGRTVAHPRVRTVGDPRLRGAPPERRVVPAKVVEELAEHAGGPLVGGGRAGVKRALK
jgi:hypothetical protein